MIKRIKKLLKFSKQKEFKKINVGNFTLIADNESPIEEFQKYHPNYSFNFSRLVAKILINDKNSLIIDIGANIGDTVALIRSEQVNNPIVCVEGNEKYIELFLENAKQFKNVKLITTYLGDQDHEINAKVITEKGTAKIIKANHGNNIKLVTLDKIFSSEKLKNVRILKVDADGFDILILKGAKKVISENLPIIFFEYDNHLNISNESCLSYLLSLAELGYDQVLFYDNMGNFLITLNLKQDTLIQQLDNYILNGGAFQYFDVAVFHSNDFLLAQKITKSMLKEH